MSGPADGYPIVVPIEVRFKDIDMMGHVNNAVFLTYFENARAGYWKAMGGRGGERERTYVVARAECDFRSPATLQDVLGCHLRIVSLGRSSFVFEYLLRDETSQRVIAEGRSVQAMYDYQAGRTRPLDEEFRERIRQFEGRPIENTKRN